MVVIFLTGTHKNETLSLKAEDRKVKNLTYILFFFGHVHSLQMFPGKGSNPHHSSYNAESLTTRPPGNPLTFIHSFIHSFIFFLWPNLRHMEIPRLGVESGLQLPAYTTATAMPDLSSICHLHHSSWQHQILNLPSRARDRIHILRETILGP